MPTKPIDRRTLLRGAGGVVLALPFLEAMRPRVARAQAVAPLHLLTYFAPNGMDPDSWFAGNTTSTGFVLSDWMKPLDPFRGDLTLVRGLKNQAALDSGGNGDSGANGHDKGLTCMLTGRKQSPGSIETPPGPSVDYVIGTAAKKANHLGPALNLGRKAQWDDWRKGMSASAQGNRIYPYVDPANAWDQVFGSFQAPGSTLDTLKFKRKTVLDLVRADFDRVRKVVGAEDRLRLDKHAAEVQTLQQRFQDFQVTNACSKPPRPMSPATVNQVSNVNARPIAELNLELAYYVMSCDLFPVVNLMWDRSSGDMSFPSLNVNEGSHALSHPGVSNYTNSYAQSQRRVVFKYLAQTLAGFYDRLKKTPTAGGTLADGFCGLWCTETEGDGHDLSRMAFALLGRANGYFKGGQHVDCAQANFTNDVLGAVAQAFGALPAGRFGDYGQGPLALLKA